jgi:hypothetical protein
VIRTRLAAAAKIFRLVLRSEISDLRSPKPD